MDSGVHNGYGNKNQLRAAGGHAPARLSGMRSIEQAAVVSKYVSYIEHFQLDRAPFGPEHDPGVFFEEGGRGKLLRQLLADIAEGKPLIRLTGSEGSGKTLLCRLVAEKLSPERFDVVRLDHPVGSFEDLLRPICLELGRKASGEADLQRSFLPEFREQLVDRREKQVRVALIIDDAEKLFLATLERLIRLIADADAEDVLQILLAGRPDLDRNLDQLAVYCDGVDLNVRYVLEPLTLAETERYVRFRLGKAGIRADMQLKIFPGDAIDALHQGAGGNMQLMGMLAEKGLVAAFERGLLKVDAETICPRLEEDGGGSSSFSRIFEQFRRYRLWVLAGAVVLLIFLLVALQTARENEPPAEAPGEQNKPVPPEPLPVDSAGPAPGDGPLPDRVPAESGSEGSGLREEIVQPGKTARQQDVQPEEPAAAGKAAQKEARRPNVPPAAPPDRVADPAAAAPRELVVIEPANRKRKEAGLMETDGKITPPARDPRKIFEERLRATSNWLAWSYRGGYTIQLMMLGSETAEENLRALLARDDYYSIKDELYILRKTSSPTLIVFYGLFDTMDQARRARDNLPRFLLKNQPYALSIKDALVKAGE